MATKVVIILDCAAYPGQDGGQYAVAIDVALLAADHLLAFQKHAVPSALCESDREKFPGGFPGCDEDGNFVTDYKDKDGQSEEPRDGNRGLIWHYISMYKLKQFTTDNWCIVLHAYHDE